MSPPPRRLTFAVGTSLLTASLSLGVVGCDEPTSNPGPQDPPPNVNEGPEKPPVEEIVNVGPEKAEGGDAGDAGDAGKPELHVNEGPAPEPEEPVHVNEGPEPDPPPAKAPEPKHVNTRAPDK